MKNMLINKKIVAVIAGSVMSLSAVSFSTGIVVAGATMIVPTNAYADKAARLTRKAERQLYRKQKAIAKVNKLGGKVDDTISKARAANDNNGVISTECGRPGQGAC